MTHLWGGAFSQWCYSQMGRMYWKMEGCKNQMIFSPSIFTYLLDCKNSLNLTFKMQRNKWEEIFLGNFSHFSCLLWQKCAHIEDRSQKTQSRKIDKNKNCIKVINEYGNHINNVKNRKWRFTLKKEKIYIKI